MCTSKICVAITRRDDHCRIEDRFEHNVYVLDCDGKIFEWCKDKAGKPIRYVNMQTKCGLLEIEVPPGCYVVGAVDWAPSNTTSQYLGNNLTHVAIVRVNCDDKVCVTLFDPSFHFCGSWFESAAKTILAGGGKGVPQALAAALKEVGPPLRAVMERLPNKDTFVQNMVEGIGTAPPRGGAAKAKKR